MIMYFFTSGANNDMAQYVSESPKIKPSTIRRRISLTTLPQLSIVFIQVLSAKCPLKTG